MDEGKGGRKNVWIKEKEMSYSRKTDKSEKKK